MCHHPLFFLTCLSILKIAVCCHPPRCTWLCNTKTSQPSHLAVTRLCLMLIYYAKCEFTIKTIALSKAMGYISGHRCTPTAQRCWWSAGVRELVVHVYNARVCAIHRHCHNKRTQSANKYGETIYMQTDQMQETVHTCAPIITMFTARLAATVTQAAASEDFPSTADSSPGNATPNVLACVGSEAMI